MKYYIVEADNEFILHKVSNELIHSFGTEHLANVLVDGNSITEPLLNFEQSTDKDNIKPLDVKSAKYKQIATCI